MDCFEKCVNKGLCFKEETPIPGKKVQPSSSLAKVFKVGSITPSICGVTISYDRFAECMKSHLFQNMPYVLHFKIYDEAILQSRDDYRLRYEFLQYLKSFPGAVFDFYLSDSALPVYIHFMNEIGWNKDEITTYHLSLDRSPATSKMIELEKARGKICIPEETLMLFPDYTLHLLKGKVKGYILEDTFRLKEIVHDFLNKLDTHYYLKDLNDFDKAFIAYHYLFDYPDKDNVAMSPLNITYAYKQIYYDPKGVQHLKPSPSGYESSPVGTYEHKMGVCTGHVRLFNSLLANPEIGIPAYDIYGTIPRGEIHCWSDFVINDHLLQCCTTMKGLFQDLDELGYKANKGQGIVDVYPHGHLTPEGIATVKEHVYQLKK